MIIDQINHWLVKKTPRLNAEGAIFEKNDGFMLGSRDKIVLQIKKNHIILGFTTWNRPDINAIVTEQIVFNCANNQTIRVIDQTWHSSDDILTILDSAVEALINGFYDQLSPDSELSIT